MKRLISILLFGVLLGAGSTYASVSSSSNYAIESDSINFAGGFSTSTSYALESTAGEIATGQSTSTSYQISAGYQQMQESFISLTSDASLVLAPSIPGVSGGVSSGTAAFTVVTDNPAGYQLTIEAEDSPAMRKDGDTIADYAPATTTPDFIFTTDASDAHFGFTPEGSDIVDAFRDNGAACGVGSSDTASACWQGLSTSSILVAESADANHPTGTETTIRFQVGVGNAVVVPPGVYTATTTITALAL